MFVMMVMIIMRIIADIGAIIPPTRDICLSPPNQTRPDRDIGISWALIICICCLCVWMKFCLFACMHRAGRLADSGRCGAGSDGRRPVTRRPPGALSVPGRPDNRCYCNFYIATNLENKTYSETFDWQDYPFNYLLFQNCKVKYLFGKYMVLSSQDI